MNTEADGSGETVAAIDSGSILRIVEVRDDCLGLVSAGTRNDALGWVDLTGLTRIKGPTELTAGDIDNDGSITIYDLSLINEYLKSLDSLPEGVSILRENERKAADINSDGKVDLNDILDCLSKIFNSGV